MNGKVGKWSVIFFLVLMSLLIVSPSHSVKGKGIGGFFGLNESIPRIVNIDLKSHEGEALFLGHKTSEHYFFAGLYLNDNGYVLGVETRPKYYYDFPTWDELEKYQSLGLIPNLLPDYYIPFWNTLSGTHSGSSLEGASFTTNEKRIDLNETLYA